MQEGALAVAHTIEVDPAEGAAKIQSLRTKNQVSEGAIKNPRDQDYGILIKD